MTAAQAASMEENEALAQTKPVRRGRRLLACAVAFFLFVFIGCGGWPWWDSQQGWTVATLEQLIQIEVPRECDRETAEAWFDRHGIQSYWRDDTTGDRVANQTMPQLVGLDDGDLSGMLNGYIGITEANVDLLFNGDIRVYFFFDKRGRLVGHLVHPFVYAPRRPLPTA